MASTKQFHLTIPLGLLDRLKKYSQEKYKSIASVIIEAVLRFLNDEGY